MTAPAVETSLNTTEAPSLGTAIANIAARTSVSDTSEAPAAPPPNAVLAITSDDGHGSPSADGVPQEQADGTPDAPQTTPDTTEPNGELSVDDGELVLRAERNPDGTFKTKIDPNAKHEFEIRDKETGDVAKYSKTIPELVRLARDGIAMQKQRGELSYYRENVPQWQEQHKTLTQQHMESQSRLADLEARLRDQMDLNRELLTAPDELVIQRREQFREEASPQRELERLKQHLAREQENARAREQQSALARQAATFVDTRLAPVIQQAEAALGGDEYARRLVAGQVALATTPFLVNGQLPPASWPQVEAHLRGPFQEWVVQTARYVKAQKAAPEQARTAQAQAQKAVNQTGQMLRPVGTVAPDPNLPQPKPKSANEAMERIINRQR